LEDDPFQKRLNNFASEREVGIISPIRTMAIAFANHDIHGPFLLKGK
jgi:hypothetical protein